MKVESSLLWEALKNASLFAREKAINSGEVQFSIKDETLTITSSDGFIGVAVEASALGNPDDTFYLQTKEVKALERQLREYPSGSIKVAGAPESQDPWFWDDFGELMQRVRSEKLKQIKTWACNPERLSMLSRLEPKGQYPLVWESVSVGPDHYWRFKYGPNTFGVLVPLDEIEIGE